jgi:hypothetical protein
VGSRLSRTTTIGGLLDFTIRPNTDGPGWDYIDGRADVPEVVARVRDSGRAVILDREAAAEVDAWIKRMGWGREQAPVFLERLE